MIYLDYLNVRENSIQKLAQNSIQDQKSKKFSFTKITPEAVKNILESLKNSSSLGISGIPTNISKKKMIS